MIRRCALTVAMSAFFLGQPWAQRPGDGVEPTTPFRVASDLVLVPAIVTDRDYRPIFDLTEEQFQLRVDHSPTPLAGFWKDTGPISLVVVLDASGSMASVMRRSHEALRGFFNLAHPGDEYALVLCKENGRVEVPFTQNLSAIQDAILGATAQGSTPLFDSLKIALDLAPRGKHERKAILVISDGEDTSSRTAFTTLRSQVLESTAYLYVLQFWTGGRPDELRFETLRELAQPTGGIYFDDVSPKRFAEYLGKLDLHQRYMLAFHPTGEPHDGKQHRLDVRLRDAKGSSARVFWRHHYVDTDPGRVR